MSLEMERPELAIFRAPVIHGGKSAASEPSHSLQLSNSLPLGGPPTTQGAAMFADPAALSLYSYYLTQIAAAQRAAAAAAAVSAFAYQPTSFFDPQAACAAASMFFASQQTSLNPMKDIEKPYMEAKREDLIPVQWIQKRQIIPVTAESKYSWINYYEKTLNNSEGLSIMERPLKMDNGNSPTTTTVIEVDIRFYTLKYL